MAALEPKHFGGAAYVAVILVQLFEDVITLIGIACLVQGEWQRAMTVIDELGPAAAYAPHLAAAAGQLLAALRYHEAVQVASRAVELDPTYAAAYNDLAVAYEHEGQLEKARQAYERALTLEPNNTQVRQNYELFKEINDRTSPGKEK